MDSQASRCESAQGVRHWGIQLKSVGVYCKYLSIYTANSDKIRYLLSYLSYLMSYLSFFRRYSREMETAKERAARRWRESQAPAEAPKMEPATVAPLSSTEVAASGWFAASAFDARARAIADTQYVFAGSFVAHHYLRDAMRRADRTAAATSVYTRPLGSDDDDIDKACQPSAHTPTL